MTISATVTTAIQLVSRVRNAKKSAARAIRTSERSRCCCSRRSITPKLPTIVFRYISQGPKSGIKMSPRPKRLSRDFPALTATASGRSVHATQDGGRRDSLRCAKLLLISTAAFVSNLECYPPHHQPARTGLGATTTAPRTWLALLRHPRWRNRSFDNHNHNDNDNDNDNG